MDISDFADSFYEEAEELLDDMERLLLELDLDEPDPEQLNAIFRAAHSIKGGAGAFGFSVLQETTHILENLLDDARNGEMQLRADVVDIFLQAKDVLTGQLKAYRATEEPDPEAFNNICQLLNRVAEQEGRSLDTNVPNRAAEQPASVENSSDDPLDRICKVLQQLAREDLGLAPADDRGVDDADESAPVWMGISLLGVTDKDRELLLDELKYFGEIVESSGDDKRCEVVLDATANADDIAAVMCFIVEPEQIEVRELQPSAPAQASPTAAAAAPPAKKPEAAPPKKAVKKYKAGGESASIRVTVDKVDQIINLVGELVITQSMLDRTAEELDSGRKGELLGGLAHLQRNARDLQEAVMSIRMLPMEHVFSRFPRQVRDLAAKLDKQVELVTEGKSTELDKGLIERITDPLTHLVRNSLDHGIETPDIREAAGKDRSGRLVLSAKHQGSNIIIEVSDDGAGLNREKLLSKAKSSGLDVSDDMTDEEVWQLIFAPGFSTAEQVSDVSGRGVGMDVVKRNIQSMGGHVEITSRPGQGTTTRVLLPLTLAIMDGMSVRVGEEMFVLPLGVISELIQPTKGDLFTMAGDDVLLKVRDEYLPVVVLHEVMDVPGGRTDMTDSVAIVVQGEERRYALLVDEPVGQQQIVVKNVETNYRKVPGVSAATILGDGRVALILDVVGLHQCNRQKKHKSDAARKMADQEKFIGEAQPS